LRSAVLAYASRYPVTGAELTADIKSRTGGIWNPSPGSVYFLMNELKEMSLLVLVKGKDPHRKAYIATEQGKSELAKVSEALLETLNREITLLSFLATMVDPTTAGRMEFLRWAMTADPSQLQRVRQTK